MSQYGNQGLTYVFAGGAIRRSEILAASRTIHARAETATGNPGAWAVLAVGAAVLVLLSVL
jgi:hypothetical protein